MTVNQPLTPLPVGRRLHGGRYEIVGHLGGGANGQVYRVRDLHQGGQVVALKLMAGTPLPGAWAESAVLTGLRGDFIVSILNADTDAGVPFIVTDVLDGGSLDLQVVAGVGVEVDRAARWIQQACTGVARVHDRGLLHNDIKPANLFLDSNHDALVGDLGLACLMRADGHGHCVGTPSTMAPEVAAGWLVNPAAPPWVTSVLSDVYSLGASLYELLAGDILNPGLRAAAGVSPVAMYTQIATHSPASLLDVAPHVPQGLAQVVMRAVSPTPSDRFLTPAELGAAIAQRTRQARRWQRVPTCAGHTMCFRGEKAGTVTITACAVPTGAHTKHEIRFMRGNTRHALPWPVVPASQLATKLRARMRAMQ